MTSASWSASGPRAPDRRPGIVGFHTVGPAFGSKECLVFKDETDDGGLVRNALAAKRRQDRPYHRKEKEIRDNAPIASG